MRPDPGRIGDITRAGGDLFGFASQNGDMRSLSRIVPLAVAALAVGSYLRARRTSISAAPGSAAADLKTGPG